MKYKLIIFVLLFQDRMFLSLKENLGKQNLLLFNSILQNVPQFQNLTQNEYEYRMTLFNKSVEEINQSNNVNDGRTKLKANFFSLMSLQEKQQYLGFKPSIKKPTLENLNFKHEPLRDIRIRKNYKQNTISSVKQTGALQYLNITYDNLNTKEKKWVDYWEAQIQKLDDIFQSWFEGIKQDCQSYIDVYGTIDKVKQFCQDYYDNSVLERHKQNVREQIEYMNQDYDYVVNKWRKTFERLPQYYQDFKRQLESAEALYQDSITTQFQEFMKIFDNNDNTTPDNNDTTPDNNNDNTTPDNNDTTPDNNDPSPPVGDPTTIREAVSQGIIPQSVDWIEQEKISPIKNQGSCGSCWAFATSGMLESMHLMQKNELIDLSEQYLINCSTQNGGCNGGLMTLALNFITSNHTTLEQHLPYAANDGVCPNSITQYKIQSWDYMKKGQDILEFLKILKERPVTIAYHVSNAFYSYQAGEVVQYNDTNICPTSGAPNHAVIAVGYFVDPVDDNNIWVNFKNSWGTYWGNDGYFKMGINNNLSSYGHGNCQMLQYYDEVTWAVIP